ncbi:pyridoxamine 5'-phosphate oxidase family protein [Nonomuraea sp. NBC_01738]|uniref:pyridoxamine 5'-phosphate oxidase family protein n=1 Tax=Nonomuraea sp. NBC_01738 TaxID=2976003 RepID=UPI002E11E1B9|nr:pyridoxamine 5'-phosphate oxidase family protein [Nonomuraea sp. NBC_01738]
MKPHPGETAIQQRSGITKPLGSARATAHLPPIAADFLARQPMLIIGAADEHGHMWAHLLTGTPGFLTAINTAANAAVNTATILVRDPTGAPPLHDGQEIGTLAIDPATRRRMRLNGHVTRTPDGLRINADQVIANCPKYLQTRQLTHTDAPTTPHTTHTTELDPDHTTWITQADTFFLATHTPGHGADTSHRGGNPGFIQTPTPRRLTWPDYPGNFMYLTLGNLELNPAAGLLFLDWEHGHTLQLTGHAHTVETGTTRHIEFDIHHVITTRNASPLRWHLTGYSPFNP